MIFYCCCTEKNNFLRKNIWIFPLPHRFWVSFLGFLTCKTPNSNTTSNFLWPYFAYPCGSPLCPGTFQTGDFKLVMSGQKACEDFGVWPIYYVRFRVDTIVKFVLLIFFYNCIPNRNRMRQGVSDYRTKICMVMTSLLVSNWQALKMKPFM